MKAFSVGLPRRISVIVSARGIAQWLIVLVLSCLQRAVAVPSRRNSTEPSPSSNDDDDNIGTGGVIFLVVSSIVGCACVIWIGYKTYQKRNRATMVATGDVATWAEMSTNGIVSESKPGVESAPSGRASTRMD